MNEQEELNGKAATAILCRALGARIVGFGLGVFGHMEIEVERDDGSRNRLIVAGEEGLGVTFSDRSLVPDGEDLALAASIALVDGKFLMQSEDNEPAVLDWSEMSAALRQKAGQ